jgi:hypothetical protein
MLPFFVYLLVDFELYLDSLHQCEGEVDLTRCHSVGQVNDFHHRNDHSRHAEYLQGALGDFSRHCESEF